MAYVSLLIVLLLFIVNLATGTDFGSPISAELRNGNPVAYLLLVAVCAMIFLFARRLNKNSHRIRSALLLLDIVGLIVIAALPHGSRLHGILLLALCVLTAIWFIVVAFDYGCPHLVVLSAVCCLLLPIVIEISQGIAEKMLVL